MHAQDTVASFLDEHELHAPPEYRLLDLVSEVGEVAKNVNTSSDYGAAPSTIRIEPDELGDVLFAAFALAHETGIDADAALARSLDKYRTRMADEGGPGSGNI